MGLISKKGMAYPLDGVKYQKDQAKEQKIEYGKWICQQFLHPVKIMRPVRFSKLDRSLNF